MEAVRESIPVLDGVGFVQYVSHMGNDLTVVNAARVSFNKESEEFADRDEKLINYLAKHNHWTPFAHPQITLRIKAPISIRTQLFKHKQGFVENEVSRRYVSDTPSVYMPRWRGKPTNGAKQGSEDFMPIDDGYNTANHHYEMCVRDALHTYEELLRLGVAPEQARFVLPQGAYTEWWWTGSLAAYARVYGLRSDPHAQWEVRQYANAISTLIEPLFPVSWKALSTKGVS
jgi:thymidylate synthase (FAD)